MKSYAAYFLLFTILHWHSLLFADTHGTPESIAVQNIKMAARTYEKVHGVQPTNWAQVGEFLNLKQLNDQTLILSSAYPIEEH